MLARRAASTAGGTSYTFLGDAGLQRLTCAELDRRARAVAAWLEREAEPGERVLLVYPPGLEFLPAFFGCLYAGAVAVPVPHPPNRSAFEKIVAIANDCGARRGLTVTEHLGAARSSVPAVAWEATDGLEEPGEPRARPAPEDLAYLQYTSGSTSAPRGVMLTHGNVLHNLASIEAGFEHRPDSVVVTWLPHFHDMGLIYGLLAPLYAGVVCYQMAPAAFIQRPVRWLEAITRYRGTHSGGPNFAYDLCVRKIRPEERAGLDLSCWEVAFNGAEPVHAETIERFSEAFAGCGFRRSAVYPAYGLAEASLKVSGGRKGQGPVMLAVDAAALARHRVSPPAGGTGRVLVSCGPAGLATRIEIVDPETHQRCAPDEIGEIWVAGPSVGLGYWQQPELSRETFEARLRDTGEGPFLRTGDLGFVHAGELFVAGRLKDVIVIRGLNHHPSDIERTARQAHPALASSVAAAFSIEAGGEERLVLVVESAPEQAADFSAIVAAVRQAIAAEHDVLLYGCALAAKGEIPRTSSGKVQRGLCRSQYLEGKLALLYHSVLAEQSPGEPEPELDLAALGALPGRERRRRLAEWLRQLVAAILHVDPAEIDPARPVAACGLDSLGAMQLASRIEDATGVRVPAEGLFDQASLDRLADLIAAAPLDGARSVVRLPAPQPEETPPSFEQERLWALEQIRPGDAAFHIPFALRLLGPIDETRLSQALRAVVARQQALRSYVKPAPGGAIKVAFAGVEPPLPVVEAPDLAAALAMAAEEVRRPFELTRAPLFRLRLIRLGAEDRLLVLVLHHFIGDVWSVRLFLEEWFETYHALSRNEAPSLPPLPSQYADFAAWQRAELDGGKLEDLSAWWREHLESAKPVELRPDGPRRSGEPGICAAERFELSAELTASLEALSRRRGLTLFTTLLAGFAALLARRSGQSDLLFAITNANRNRAQWERLIGFFATPLPVRVDLGGDPSSEEMLERVRSELAAAYAHQELPFAKIVEAARLTRSSNSTPPPAVAFSMVKAPLPETVLPAVKLEAVDLEPPATDFDLFLTVVDGGAQLSGWVVAGAGVFTSSTLRALVESYRSILETIAADAKARLSELPVASGWADKAREATAIVVAATFTAEPVGEILAFWDNELGWDSPVRFAPYNQVFQQLLDPGSLTRANRGVNVLLIRLQDWLGSAEGRELEETVGQFVAAVRRAAAASAAAFLVFLCPSSPELAAQVHAAEEELARGLSGLSRVHLIGSGEVEALYPVARRHEPQADELGRIPYTPEYFAALGAAIARKVHALAGRRHKVIALDCDNTLWKGVCGEDGPLGVSIDPPQAALQEFVRAQRDSGMLLALASKNDAGDVWATFAAHPEMPLRREDFVAWRINWAPKSQNLRELARELDLGLDSFIFIDDNPAECAEVRANCPEVLVLQLPARAEQIPEFLRHVWAFDHLGLTEEDRLRSTLYSQRLERARLEQQVATLGEFLRALELEVRIAPVEPRELGRVAQLSQRTNQMNFTARRRTEAEIAALLGDGGAECLTVHVSDRFGSYGLVGAVIFHPRDGCIELDSFLLSCRALGRGVEHRMLAQVGRIAVERGLEWLIVPCRVTARNQPARDFLASVGRQFERPAPDGFIYRFPAAYAARITFDPDARPRETPPAPPERMPPETRRRPVDYGRIAVELRDPAMILERVKRARPLGKFASGSYEPPRTPLEEQLAALWAEMLGLPRVGIYDNFFDLGGHSLLAVQMLARVRQAFDADLPLEVIFAGNFCVAELAKAVELVELEKTSPEQYEALVRELEAMSDEEVRALLRQESRGESGA
jgi:FkbH-like protein